ncbi:MAG TPA: nickel pincer cofactor biosynthesis protein LarB [Deltaproteobacteria bacterium]|nr:nickel pincer cofactor biosynthesis protein LarB [Deltaproteobacteria bacterium]HIJ35934.1 nickel pincer cofactor biosynthesis protein LarB [Deltaproteobacteria bacterium]
MDQDALKDLLTRLHQGKDTIENTMLRLKNLPFEDVGFACIDHHRPLRKGLSEVIFGQGKEPDDILVIMDRMLNAGDNVLVTRLTTEKAEIIRDRFPDSTYYKKSRILTLIRRPIKISGRGTILVMSAGTSDIPVAEEAVETARFMGNEVDAVFDVGVSGIHRLFSHREKIVKASVVIVVAGMEGALPSVVGGMVDRPVIAVPTSIGYGASFGGIAALLGMLNSCSAGVTVVNIDNGFGAGYAASVMNRD